MKKVIIGMLVLSMMLGLAACGSAKSESDLLQKSADGKIIILSSKIVTQITGADGEYIMSKSASSPDEYVYVDMSVYIENTKSEAFSAESFEGTLTYDGKDYELGYGLENALSTGVSTDPLPANSSGIVHIFAKVPSSALTYEGDIIPWFTYDGVDYGMKASPMDYSEPRSQKKELKTGDTDTILDGKVQIKVRDVGFSNVISPTGNYDLAYETNPETGESTFNVCLEITNNSSSDITEFIGYLVNGKYFTRANILIEDDGNGSFSDMDETNCIKSGTTKIIHLFADKSASTDSYMRFNCLGSCYIIKKGS